jgi:hypothetical protein
MTPSIRTRVSTRRKNSPLASPFPYKPEETFPALLALTRRRSKAVKLITHLQRELGAEHGATSFTLPPAFGPEGVFIWGVIGVAGKRTQMTAPSRKKKNSWPRRRPGDRLRSIRPLSENPIDLAASNVLFSASTVLMSGAGAPAFGSDRLRQTTRCRAPGHRRTGSSSGATAANTRYLARWRLPE